MTTGEGIFYGLVFIGLILLYVVTRDRWKWRKIAKWTSVVMLLPVIAAGTWAGYSRYMEDQPKVQSEFWGVSPGVPKSELIFLKGKPTRDDDGSLTYESDATNVTYLVVLNKSGNVRSVLATAPFDKSYSLPTIQGVSNYSTISDIESKFGKADSASSNKDGTRRLYCYLKYGIVVGMEKGTVIAVGILNPKEGPLEFSDH